MIAGDILSYTDTTTAHPIGVVALILCSLYLIATTRNKVMLPVLLMVALIPSAQRVVIFSLDLNFIRIILLVALMRIFLKGEHSQFRLNNIDKVIIIWGFWSICTYGILKGDFSAVVSRTGYMMEAFGAYMVGRFLIRDIDDLKKVVNFLGIISIPVAVFVLLERSTGNNLFSIFGGVPFETLERGGRLRCQGPFTHPIMAGVFWASILPWFGAMWFLKELNTRKLILFTALTLFIIVNTASSTPVMAVLLVGVGFFFFTFRRIMPLIRYFALFGAIALHFIMEKGVFHLIARIDIAGGSTGWHRYILIDRAFAHINEWWLVGTLSTSHWGAGLADITNQYILEGVRGGVISMLLFVLMIVLVFRGIGRNIRIAETRDDIWLLWAIGTLMFMHAMNFLAVSYFGSVVASFYLFLGASVSIIYNQERARKQNLTESKMRGDKLTAIKDGLKARSY